MASQSLYIFIASAFFLVLTITGWAGRDLFEGVSYWVYVTGFLGVILFIIAFWTSRSELKKGFSQRSTRSGIQVTIMCFVVVALIFVLNLFSFKHFYIWDITPGQFHSLSNKTVKILQKLDREKIKIEFIAFIRKLRQPSIKEALERYTRTSSQVSFKFFDLDANPTAAKLYDVKHYGTIVVVHRFSSKNSTNKLKSIVGRRKLPLSKDFRSEKIYSLSENAIVNAILKTVQTEQKKVYFLIGHGERLFTAGKSRRNLSALANFLRVDNYRTEQLFLVRKKSVPSDAKILIIADPRKDITSVETSFLEDYISKGGRLLVFLEPNFGSGDITLKNLFSLLKNYGFKTPKSYVIDPQAVRFAMVGGNALTPFVASYGIHEITKSMKGFATVFPTARIVSFKGNPKIGLKGEELIKTGKGSFWVSKVEVSEKQLSYDEKSKTPGPVNLGAAASVQFKTNKKEARIVVYGDVDFATDGYIGMQGNTNLVLNSVNWLGGEKDLISIRPKTRTGDPLLIEGNEGSYVWILTFLVIPIFIILIGTAVYVARRRLR
ncbi:MAG: GldG family protein [Nitrospinota bacterium]|nr:GldG family protein [Nitrospinota bacterium]